MSASKDIENSLRPEDILVAWMEAANERYRREQIPPRRRAFKALQDLSAESGRSVVFGSPASNKVFDWFEANTKPGSHALGALFTGAFYFDACFWPTTIPIFYGQCRLNPLDALQTMPPVLKEALWRDGASRGIFLHYWSNCFDYALGADVVSRSSCLTGRAAAFFANADRELTGAISQLLDLRPNPKAILSFRMACEIFLKVFLIHEKKLSDDQLKKSGHRIDLLAKECFACKPLNAFTQIGRAAAMLPEVSDRYDGTERTLPDVFDATFLAQLTASTVTRHLSGEDTRDRIFGNQAHGAGEAG